MQLYIVHGVAWCDSFCSSELCQFSVECVAYLMDIEGVSSGKLM